MPPQKGIESEGVREDWVWMKSSWGHCDNLVPPGPVPEFASPWYKQSLSFSTWVTSALHHRKAANRPILCVQLSASFTFLPQQPEDCSTSGPTLEDFANRYLTRGCFAPFPFKNREHMWHSVKQMAGLALRLPGPIISHAHTHIHVLSAVLGITTLQMVWANSVRDR